MKLAIKKVLKKTVKIVGITLLSLFLILWLLPYILPGTIGTEIKKLVNKSLNGEINFSKARLSFFNHFPSLTLTLHDFSLKGSAPFQNDTLLSASEMAFGINLPSLIRGNIHVDKFFLTEADIRVIVNEKGEANYNVYKSASSDSSSSTSSADTSTALQIEKIVIEQSNLVYDDKSSAVFIGAKGLDYTGQGDLSKAIFDLRSHLVVDSFDFYYDKVPYILKKKINADLLTSINTNSLALKFQRNLLHINKLPVEFVGRFDFLSRGYDMDFRLNSKNADLDDVFTVIPPQYQGWLEKTKIRGKANILTVLSGRYIADTDSMPSLNYDMQVREGFISYDKAPIPVSNLYLDFKTNLPGLNMDSLTVNVDSAFFNMNKDYFSLSLKTKGYESPYLFARANCEMDLEQLDRSLGIGDYDFKGKLNMHLLADGTYSTGQNPGSIRKDIVITSIPVFNLQTSVNNGYFHYNALPQPIQNISFQVNAACKDHQYQHTSLAIENIDVKAMNNYLKGFLRIKNLDDLPIEANVDAIINLSDIQQFYPLDSMAIDGNMTVNVQSNGNYQPGKKMFPKTVATLKLENGSLQTKYYPAPIQKIAVDATIKNKQGTLADMDVDLKPISFEFDGNPFMIQADLRNFDNLQYNIVSKGRVDLGKIYKVFAYEGLDVKGTIETDLSLKGTEADATAGRYNRLDNRGILKVNNILLYSDLYPKPFEIDQGVFRFVQDQMRFESFRLRYGQSTMILNGAFSHLFDYMTGTGPLHGELKLQSDYILLDELMAYKGDASSVRADSVEVGSSGVLLIPADLDLKLNTDIKTVDYNKLHIKNVRGEVALQSGELKMNQTGFTLSGAETVMDASYKALSPARAYFTYHVVMKDFDVKKMYNEVELFRELAPAAGKAEGIIALDYSLEGKLNADMYPVMPSLKGGGVLSIKKVKMKGFKLFSAMGKETGKNEINDPDLSKIDFKTSIKNNIVTLEKTKMKVSGFRLRLQGQTSLDGQLKLKCRIGLPPFGIVGIPVNVTGTGDNPKIKVGKGDELPLEEQKEEMDDGDEKNN